jgi:DNA-binding NarL/FixJ family response regulator
MIDSELRPIRTVEAWAAEGEHQMPETCEPLRLLLADLARSPAWSEQVRACANGLLEAIGTRDVLGPAPVPCRASSSDCRAEPLTSRELDVLRLLAEGNSNRDIAETLAIREGTVKSHVNHILSKLAAHNRTQAAAHARALHLV